MKQSWSTRMTLAVLAGCFTTGLAHAATMPDVARTADSIAAGTEASIGWSEDAGQAGDHMFDSFASLGAKAKESNEVTLDKSMLGLVARKGGDKAELAKKLDLVEIRNYEFANEGEYNLADVLAITKRLEGDGWKHIVRNRDGKALNDIAVKQDSEGVTKEMVIINADTKELNLVHVRGNVTVSDMHHMGGLMGGVMQDDNGASNNSGSSSPKLQKH